MNLEDYFDMLHEMAKSKPSQSRRSNGDSHGQSEDSEEDEEESPQPEDKGAT